MLARIIPGTLGWIIFLAVSATNVLVGVFAQVPLLPFDRARKASLWADHWVWGRVLWFAQPFWRFHPRGLDRVGGRGPYIIVANHQSVLDIPAVMHLPLPIRVLAKSSLFRVPIMGTYMRFSRQVEVPAQPTAESALAVVDTCRDHLTNGVSILIFPEGTRSIDGQLGRFQKGAFRLAKDLDIPVLPIAIRGTEKILSKGRLWNDLFRVDIHLRVLDPIDPNTCPTARRLSRHVRDILQTEIHQIEGAA